MPLGLEYPFGMPDLKTTLDKLAADFAQAAVAAIQHASLDEVAGIGASRRPRAATAPSAPVAAPRGRRGRRHRRSAADIAKVTDAIAALLLKSKQGMRAEEIRATLGITKPELLSPIAEGLASGKFRKRGEKRATTYFIGGGNTPPPKAKARTAAKAKAKKTGQRRRVAKNAAGPRSTAKRARVVGHTKPPERPAPTPTAN